MKKFLMFFMAILILSSCNKQEGPGGTATLKGKIKVKEYNQDFTVLKAEYYAQAENVYLIYGDDNIYSEDFKTGPDGSFEFSYLRKGKYGIFAYEADSTGVSPTGMKPLYKMIEISKNNSVVDIGDITIIKASKDASGTSSISGRIYCRNYNVDFSVLIAQYYAPDEDVFLVYGDNLYYSDDLKSDIDGWYKFEHVPIGHYTVYAFSKDSTFVSPSGYIASKREIDITANEQHVVLNDIVILK
jgi:hypothetical protein